MKWKVQTNRWYMWMSSDPVSYAFCWGILLKEKKERKKKENKNCITQEILDYCGHLNFLGPCSSATCRIIVDKIHLWMPTSCNLVHIFTSFFWSIVSGITLCVQSLLDWLKFNYLCVRCGCHTAVSWEPSGFKCCALQNKAVLEPRVSPAFAITYFCNHCNI